MCYYEEYRKESPPKLQEPPTPGPVFFFSPWTVKVCVNLFFWQRFTDTNLRSRALFWLNSRAKRCVHGHFFWLFTGTFWLFTGTFLVHGHLFFCSRALFLCSRAHFWHLFTGSCEMFTGIFLILFTGTFQGSREKKKNTLISEPLWGSDLPQHPKIDQLK